jgi:hypothetical protein
MEKASSVLRDVGRETGCSVTLSNPVRMHDFLEPFAPMENMQGKHAIAIDSIQGPFLCVEIRVDGTNPHEVLDYMRTAILQLSHHSRIGYQINPKDVVISQLMDEHPSTSCVCVCVCPFFGHFLFFSFFTHLHILQLSTLTLTNFPPNLLS